MADWELKDVVGDVLGVWKDYQEARLNNRLLEIQYQNAALMIPAQYQNAQATAGAGTTAGDMGTWAKENKGAVAVIAVAVLGLAYLALK